VQFFGFDSPTRKPFAHRQARLFASFGKRCPALSIIFPARAGNGLLWVDPVLHWGVDKMFTRPPFPCIASDAAYATGTFWTVA
jgi:hypothetical protein